MKYETKRWSKPIQTADIKSSGMIDLLEDPVDNAWRLKAKRLQARRWRKLRQKPTY